MKVENTGWSKRTGKLDKKEYAVLDKQRYLNHYTYNIQTGTEHMGV